MLATAASLRRETKERLSMLSGRRLTREMILRIAIDALLVNVALVIALALRCLWAASVQGGARVTPIDLLDDWLGAYLKFTWLLTVTSIVVFYGSGFYTRNRAYRGRHKALAIIWGVSLSYLIFGFQVLLLRGAVAFPRTVVLIAWFLTLALVGGARLWSPMWLTFAEMERRLVSEPPTSGVVNRVLVIGGAGYIGSALTRRLLALGYHVRVLDLLVYGDESIREFYHHPGFELLCGDFCHIDTVVKGAQGMDAIVHLGAIVGDSACQICEELTVEINLRATRTIAEVGKGFGVTRFVFASTCSVYGASDEILDERSGLNPLSLYARTKMESEKVLLALADDTFAPIILRFGTIFGLSGRPRFDLVVNLLAAKAVKDGEFGIVGGKQWRPFVHVKDVAEAIVLSLEAPRRNVCGQIFNVGSNDQNYQIGDLGELIREFVPNVRETSQAIEDPRNYRVRFDKISKTLNFQPKYTVREGVKEVVNAFTTGQIADYQDPCYNNSTYLKQHSALQRSVIAYRTTRDQVAATVDGAPFPAAMASARRQALGQVMASPAQPA